MKPIRALALLAVVSLVAACATDDEPTTRRRTASTTGEETPTDTTDGTDPGTDPGTGGNTTTGILILEATASNVTGAVGQQVNITAQGWLNSAKTTPVTSGTMISFSAVGGGTLTPSSAAANAQGRATVSVGKSNAAPGAVTVTATLSGISSNPTTVVFLAPGSGSTGTGGTGTTVRTVGGVSVYFNKTAVVVNNDSVVDTSDEADVIVTVTDNSGLAFAGQTITLSSTDGSLSAITGTTNASGQVVVKFAAGIIAQEVTVSAETAGKSGNGVITVGPGAPLVINVSEPSPAQIGIRGTGNESSVVTFTITDKYGNPVSDNTVVTFSILPAIAGVSVAPASTTTHGGVVSPVVNAGTKAGTVRLIASVPSVGRSVSSGKITIFGGVPSQSNFQLAADTFVLSGYYHNGLIANLTVTLTDNYENPVVPGTSIYVTCEAGRCGANNSTGIATDEAGHATFEVESAFQNLLWDSGASTVVDFGSPIGTNHAWPALGDPRDGKVRVLAIAVGESGFWDSNSNGIFDGNDRLRHEFSEPFVDVNDDGAYNDGSVTTFIEDFWDYDGDGAFDAATGAYKDRSYIWAQHNLIWSDWPAPYAAPEQYVDIDGNGIYNAAVDYFAVGGPVPASQTELRTRFSWMPLTATLSTGFPGFVSSGTAVAVNFSDTNNNPLPGGTVMTAAALIGDAMDVKSPASGSLTYSGDSWYPMGPRTFVVTDKDMNKPHNAVDRFCPNVKLGDTGDEAGLCIKGVIF